MLGFRNCALIIEVHIGSSLIYFQNIKSVFTKTTDEQHLFH